MSLDVIDSRLFAKIIDFGGLLQMNIGIHAFVSGKVQGVFFRAHTCRKAQSLNLMGWVKNLPDGRVETVAYGPRATVMLLVEWLHQGPAASDVSEVHWEDIPWQALEDFQIVR